MPQSMWILSPPRTTTTGFWQGSHNPPMGIWHDFFHGWFWMWLWHYNSINMLLKVEIRRFWQWEGGNSESIVRFVRILWACPWVCPLGNQIDWYLTLPSPQSGSCWSTHIKQKVNYSCHPFCVYKVDILTHIDLYLWFLLPYWYQPHLKTCPGHCFMSGSITLHAVIMYIELPHSPWRYHVYWWLTLDIAS